MDVLFLSPGHPSEMPEFVRGLSEVGARVWGVAIHEGSTVRPDYVVHDKDVVELHS